MSDLDDFNERLNKLKEFNKTTKDEQVTDEQLHEKLRKLKGLKDDNKINSTSSSSNYYVPPKFKSETEETDYLLKQLQDETEVDNKFNFNQTNEDDKLFSNLLNHKNDTSKYDNKFNDNFTLKSTKDNSKDSKLLNEKEFNKELNYLKNRMKELNYNYKDNPTDQSKKDKIIFSNHSSEEDEEEQFTQIVKKFVDEADLEEATGQNKTNDQQDDFNLDKFDFCYICNEDAVIECKNCDDRFCLDCCKEFHQDPEYKDHSFKKFK